MASTATAARTGSALQADAAAWDAEAWEAQRTRGNRALAAGAPDPPAPGRVRAPIAHFVQRAQGEGKQEAGSLPPRLRAGLEALSGMALDDVRVHYGSPQPGAVGAHAFTQGGEIHVAPGEERTLPHEGWHAVQQRQGRVAATARVGGRAANLDPALEAEAQQMGAQAAALPAGASVGSLRRGTAPASAPLQGLFKYQGRVVVKEDPTQAQRSWWKDEETGDIYVWLRDGQIHPVTHQRIVVVRRSRDGRTINARVLNDQWDLEPIEGADEREERTGGPPWQPPQSHRPTFTEEAGSALKVTMHDEPKMSATVQPPNPESFQQQFQRDPRLQGLRNARFDSPFTVNPYLVPLAQGQAVQGLLSGGGEGTTDFAYRAQDVGVAEMQVGDKDRPDTYLEPKQGKSSIPQGRHTVAWALVRRSFMAMKGRRLTFVLHHLRAAFGHLIPHIASREARLLIDASTPIETIDRMLDASLKLEAWNHLIAPLFNLYAVVYHQTEGAVFAGKSKQRGESEAVDSFGTAEGNLQRTQPIGVDVGDLTVHAANLLDINFTVRPHQYAFAVHHWIETLSETYPLVMRAHGPAIVEPVMEKPITAKAYKVLTYPDPADATRQVPVTKVEHLLLACGYPTPSYGALTAPANFNPQQIVKTFTFVDLKSAFTAHVTLQKLREGIPINYPSVFGPAHPPLQLFQYAVAELQVADIALSDVDRPKTKGGSRQFSHVVPWTLLRTALMAFSGKPLSELMLFLTEEFKLLKDDMPHDNVEAQRLVSHARTGLADLKGKRFAEHDWREALSSLIKLYAHAYQISRSAVFADERTLGIAEGHGEPAHMRVLRECEMTLGADGQLAHPPDRILQATTALYDAYIPAGRNAEHFARAFRHWQKLLTRAFPHVMELLGADIVRALGNKNVGTAQAPALLKDALAPFGIKTE